MSVPSISTKSGSISSKYLKRTAEILGSATGSYFKEASPTVVSIKTESIGALRGFQATISNNVLPKTKQLSMQVGFRKLNQWFLNESNSVAGVHESPAMTYDTDTDGESTVDGSVISEIQISTSDRQTNQLAKTMIDTSHKLMETQISATANMMTGIEGLGATMTAGFETLNETMSKLLEVTTKNSAALIEITAAGIDNSPGPIKDGKLDLNNYANMVRDNVNNSSIVNAAKLASTIGKSGMLTSTDVIGGALTKMFNKANPNLKKNIQAFDSTLNELMMSSLIRLGENSSNRGMLGTFAKMFGIRSDREKGNASDRNLELKNVQFNTLTQEAVVNVMPGYLQRILKQLGGDDVTYDYKSRQFKTRAVMQRDYSDKLAGGGGAYRRASGSGAAKAFSGSYNNTDVRDMLYDLMMDEFGAIGTAGSRSKLNNKSGKEFINELLREIKGANQFKKSNASDLQSFATDYDIARRGSYSKSQLISQAAVENVARNSRRADLAAEGESYFQDPKSMKDNGRDKAAILRRYGINTDAGPRVSNGRMATSGVDYTNSTLFEIHRLLSTGINVFEVGKNTGRLRQASAFSHSALTPPSSYRAMGRAHKMPSMMSGTDPGNGRTSSAEGPMDEDGNRVTISGAGVKEWGKANSRDIKEALFSGDPARVRDLTVRLFNDTTEFAGEKIKKFFGAKDNELNFSGWLKESIFGKRTTDADGNDIRTSRGILGSLDEFIFGDGGAKGISKRVKESTSKWFSEAASYFNNGVRAEPGDDSNATQVTRNKIFGASLGMVAGLGFLGGPLGLIAGGLAGNALSGTNGIGNKIKEVLFGKDYTDKKGKEKHKLGIVERVVNSITDPLRYQLGKTATAFGAMAKKNILGPLANLGEAIKDRVANAAESKAGKVFGWIFDKGASLMQKVIMAPFKLIGVAGSATRGAAGATTGLFGGAINALSNRLAVTDEAKERLRANREKYAADYDATTADSEFYAAGGQKAWIRKQNESRKNRGGFTGIMEEQLSELVTTTRTAAERDAEVGARMTELANAGLERGSIFTHDDGVHTRLDQIISLMSGNYRRTEEDQFANAMASTGVTAAMSGSFNRDDADDAIALTNMAADGNGVSKPNLVARMRSIFKRNVANGSDENGDDKKGSSLFDMLGGLLGGKGGIIALLAGALALFNEDVRKFLGDMAGSLLGNLGTGAKNLVDYVINGADSGQKNAALNAVTSPFDVKTDSAFDYINPASTLKHVQTDAAGNDVTNISATNARNQGLFFENMRRGSFNRAFNTNMTGIGASPYQREYASGQRDLRRSIAADNAGNTRRAAKYNERYLDSGRRLSEMGEPGALSQNSTVRNVANVGSSLMVGAVGGKVTGWLAGKAATLATNHLGMDEDAAANIQGIATRGAETVGTIVTTQNALRNKGLAGKAKKALVTALDFIVTKIAANPKFAGAVATVTTFINGIKNKVLGEMTEKLTTLLAKKMGTETAKAVVGAGTAGIGIAALGVVGAVSGGVEASNLFAVPANKVNAFMRVIASALGAIFMAVPYVGLIEVLDLIIKPMSGSGIRQWLAQTIYESCGGDDLEAKQGELSAEKDAYNEKFGSNVDSATYNDIVNRSIGSKILKGGNRTTSDGRTMMDEAGAVVSKGGLKGMFVARTGYATDADGNVLRDANNKAISGIDEHGRRLRATKLDADGNAVLDKDGNPVLENKRIGNYIGDATSAVSGLLLGKKTYATDDNGKVLYDSDGKPILESKEKNIFGKIGDAAVNTKNAVSEFFFGKKKDKEKEKDSEADAILSSKTSTNLFGTLNSTFRSNVDVISKAMDKLNKSGYELDENGKPLLDANGKQIKKGTLGAYFSRTIGGIGSTVAKSIKSVASAIEEKGLFGAAADGVKSAGQKVSSWFSNIFGGNKSDAKLTGGGSYTNPALSGRGATASLSSNMSLTDRFIKQLSPQDPTGGNANVLPGDSARTRIRNLFYQGNYSGLNHMADAGCGPISASFLASVYGKTLSPIAAANLMRNARWRDATGATSVEGIEAVGQEMGLELMSTKPDVQVLMRRLQANEPVILLGKSNNASSPFTKQGHYIVATSIDSNGNISIMDSLSRTGRKVTIADITDGLESMTYTKRSGLPDLISELPANKAFSNIIGRIGKKFSTFAPVKKTTSVAKKIVSGVKNTVSNVIGNIKSLFGRGEGGFGEASTLHGFPMYQQGGNSPWAQKSYSATGDRSQTMATAACGPTAMAMILAGAGKNVNPYDAAQNAIRGGDLTPNNGTGWGYFGRIGNEYGLQTNQSRFSNSALDQSIAAGKPVILNGTGGAPFTNRGHYVTVVGKSGDKYLINDPNNKSGAYSKLDGAREMWSFANRDGSGILKQGGFGDETSQGIFTEVFKTAKSIITEFNRTFGLDSFSDNISDEDRDPENNEPATDRSQPAVIAGPVKYLTTAEVAKIQTKREAKEIIDLATMKVINFSWAASSNYHSDCTPMTPADVKTIQSILHPKGGVNWKNTNSWSWNGRPGILKLNGQYIACGFHLRPHAAIMGGSPGAPLANKSNSEYAYSKSEKWPLGGHICCYYGDSPGGTQSCNKAAKEAYKLGNAKYKSLPGGSGIGGGFGDEVSPLDTAFKVTSPFGPRKGGQHNGIDLVPANGSKSAAIRSTVPGTVAKVGTGPSEGNYVTVNGADGRTYQFFHLKSKAPVTAGQKVDAGQTIGTMGSTGRSTGPHLHYGIKEGGRYLNPAGYLSKSLASSGAAATAMASTSASSSSEASSSKSLLGQGFAAIKQTFGSIGKQFMSVFGLPSGDEAQLSDSNYATDATTASAQTTDLGGFKSVAGDIPATIFNFLTSKGCSTVAACAVLGNAQQESGVNPDRKQSGGGPGRGIFQWEEGSGRFSALTQLARSRGKNWNDLESQLMFMWNELNSSDINSRFKGKHASVSSSYASGFEKNLTKVGGIGTPGGFAEWMKSTNLKLATSNFEGAYERAGTPMMENRWKYAKNFYDRFSKESKASASPSGTTSKSTMVTSTKFGFGGEDEMLQFGPGGIGGPADSTINPNFVASYGTAASKTKNSISPIVERMFTPTSSSVIPNYITANGYNDDISSNNQGSGSRANLNVLERTLSLVLTELQSINDNTSNANGYLDGINQKEFSGGMSRDAGQKAAKVIQKKQQQQKSKGTNPFPYNARNVSSVMSIVRPN